MSPSSSLAYRYARKDGDVGTYPTSVLYHHGLAVAQSSAHAVGTAECDALLHKHRMYGCYNSNVFCIVGENGSGKTTLMKTILRLLSPIEGKIYTGDGLLPDEIGYLPQQTEVQRDFPASVKEIVLSGCQSRCGKRPFYNKAEKELAVENMKKMGVFELQNRCYRELSGGQQQRVLLARALCATQKMLLLDV